MKNRSQLKWPVPPIGAHSGVKPLPESYWRMLRSLPFTEKSSGVMPSTLTLPEAASDGRNRIELRQTRARQPERPGDGPLSIETRGLAECRPWFP